MKEYLSCLISILILIGCSKKEKVNFTCAVDENGNFESHHLLSMFESANYELLNENDSLFRSYLNDSEIEIAKLNEDLNEKSRNKHKHQYHVIEEVKKDNFTLLFIGRSIIGSGRNYTILFRIIDEEKNIINTVNVAAWNESGKSFYGSEVSDDWTKIRHIYDGEILQEFTIDKDWRIRRAAGNNT